MQIADHFYWKSGPTLSSERRERPEGYQDNGTDVSDSTFVSVDGPEWHFSQVTVGSRFRQQKAHRTLCKHIGSFALENDRDG